MGTGHVCRSKPSSFARVETNNQKSKEVPQTFVKTDKNDPNPFLQRLVYLGLGSFRVEAKGNVRKSL
jgi:hypothetical protein